MDEPQFIAEIVRRTGCGVLLDVNNVYVSSVNHGRNPRTQLRAFVDALPAAAIGEIHLAGFAEDADDFGDLLLIDDHGADVDADVWALYGEAVARLGRRPTLIERDNDVPALAVLEAEAAQARTTQAGLGLQVRRHAGAVAPAGQPA
jgi:hypothetical protein